jgi:hypothetical protein
LKQFFQRLQQGLPLTSSEKLNSVHSKLRNFARNLITHPFFKTSVAVADTRLAHFDIAAKSSAIEIEGIDTGLRFEDLKAIFEAQKNFSVSSAIAKRMRAALELLSKSFPAKEQSLKNRTVVQSLVTFVCRLVETGNATGLEPKVAQFFRHFMDQLAHQVELGQAATDFDYVRFQKSINANVRVGARIRQEILLRKAFMHDSALADSFDPSALKASGISGRVRELAEGVAAHITRINAGYAATHGEDLFKATNKTAQALLAIGRPVSDLKGYSSLMGDLYFLFREAIGQRLQALPESFVDVNTLRTDLQHDVDHGEKGKIRAKRKKIGDTFQKYSGIRTPQLLAADKFVLVQANVLSAIDQDLGKLAIP